jgi:hypothetical protein
MMMSLICWCRAAINLVISGLVLAVLVLLALFLWYLVMLAMIYWITLDPGHPGSVLPGQESASASALSTGEASRAWRAGVGGGSVEARAGLSLPR